MKTYEEHIMAAEEGLQLAHRQEKEFEAWAATLPESAIDDDPLLIHVMAGKMQVIQVALAAAQVHAALAVAKR